jgi:trans-2-enoyl-CoA reductase
MLAIWQSVSCSTSVVALSARISVAYGAEPDEVGVAVCV